MTDKQRAIAIAHAAIKAAGFTPCTASQFAHAGRLFAFSFESAHGFSASGPAFEIVVDIETADETCEQAVAQLMEGI